MRSRTRARLVFAALAAALLAAVGALAAGCGSKFELPTEHVEGRAIAGNGVYQMITTKEGLTDIQDVLLTPSGELYLLFQNTTAKTGRVEEYSPSMSTKLSTTFAGLHNPTAICFGANKLFVLDQGDTTVARTDFQCIYSADCGPLAGFSRPITDLSQYWYVHEFELDGAIRGTFTDTTFAWVDGVAADAQGRVYVSGIIMYCNIDAFDSRVRTLTTRHWIRRFLPGNNGDGVIGDWHRDATWQIAEGTGIGFAVDPRGMQWSAVGGDALYFADHGANEMQKFADPESYGTSFKLEIDVGTPDADTLVFNAPLDVSVDADGYVYVLDAGNHRALRYAPDRPFVQRVDVELDGHDPRRPLTEPVAVSADNEQVYVADRALNEVVRYRRRK